MADPVVPQTKSIDQRMNDVLNPPPAPSPSVGQPSPNTPTPDTTSEGAPVPAAGPTPAETKRRLLKVKIDHEEKEIDLEAEYDDEGKRKTLAETYQKGYGYDRALERARSEQAQAVRQAWTEFAEDHGYAVVEAPGTKWGWKLAPKQATTPATATSPDTDPLTTEEREIQAKIDAADVVDPKWLRRLSQIDAERARLAAIKEWEGKQSAAAQEAQRARRYEEAKAWMNGEIEKLVTARTKSFDGLSPVRLARLRQAAFAAAEAAAKAGQDPEAAAKSVIFDEANELDAIRGQSSRATTPPAAKPSGAPVVGVAPGGGTSKNGKSVDEIFNEVLGISGSRR